MTIYSCVVGSRYTMTAGLYVLDTVQDPDTGEFNREYVLEGTIACYAAAIAASGKDQPGVYEEFYASGRYKATDFIRIYSRNSIPKQFKVAKLTTSDGIVFTEDDGVPTIYDSNGSVPLVGANGKLVEYITMLSRSEVQDGSIL
jgi:hypothetical protein